MGVFSWFTQDTNRSIATAGNPAGRHTCKVTMTDNKGNRWHEDKYEGYGEFGGKDYYELLAEMNGLTTREEGIDLAYEEPHRPGLLFPNLTEDPNWQWRNEEPQECPDQGYFYSVKNPYSWS